MSQLSDRKAAWEAKVVAKTLARAPERSAQFETSSGIPVERLHTPDAAAEACPQVAEEYLAKLGFPGEYPFTRGVQPTMYRGRFWTMRQYAGFGTAAESNQRYKYLLAQGQTGLSVAFDLPTQIGYDADDPICLGEVGKVGVAISSLADMETLLDGIPLDKVSISMTINAPAAILLAMVIAVARKQGVDPKGLRGTVQNDILKEYIARGTYIFPPAPSMRLITDLFRYCAAEVPNWNTISISGYHIREAGSTAVQEVAFTLANGIEYVKAAIAAGLAVDDFGPQLAFFFNAHNNFLEEVAKFRAARRHVGGDHARAVRRAGSQELAAALPHPDRRLDADRAAAGKQRRARDAPGAGRGAGRNPKPAHQLQGRGAGAAERGGGRSGAAHPAGHRL